MEILNLIMGTDNIYRYLFVGGIILIFISLFYPLEKRFELENQKNRLIFEKGIIDLKIMSLKGEIKAADKSLAEFKILKNKLQKKENNDLQKTITSKIKSIELNLNELEVQNVKLKYEASKINTLNTFISSYGKYENLFFSLGLLFSFGGLIGWLYTTHKDKK